MAFSWLDTTEGLSFHHMDLTHKRMLSYHHNRQEDVFFNHMYLNMRRTLDIQTHELYQWEVYLLSTKSVTIYPGAMSVIRVKDIRPCKCRKYPNHSHTAPRLPLHRQSRVWNIYKNELDQKHAYYMKYGWLCYPSHAYIPITNISHI